MSNLIADIEKDDRKYRGKSILNIIENMKRDCVEKLSQISVFNGMHQRMM